MSSHVDRARATRAAPAPRLAHHAHGGSGGGDVARADVGARRLRRRLGDRRGAEVASLVRLGLSGPGVGGGERPAVVAFGVV
jgi:hypothetical protein